MRRRIRSGSSSPVVVDTAGGAFVAKLRGAGHGVAALVSELVVAELAALLDLPVPERVIIELAPDVATDDKNDELADLIGRSVGENVGIRLLEGAIDPKPRDLTALGDDFAARTLWLDGLVMNPDRTFANPNILLWKAQPWLIDHGAALPFQHRLAALDEDVPRESFDDATHVFSSRRAHAARADATLAAMLTRAKITRAVEVVPPGFFADLGFASAARARALYVAFIWKRLRPPRPFVDHR